MPIHILLWTWNIPFKEIVCFNGDSGNTPCSLAGGCVFLRHLLVRVDHTSDSLRYLRLGCPRGWWWIWTGQSIVTSLRPNPGIMKGNHPKMAEVFRWTAPFLLGRGPASAGRREDQWPQLSLMLFHKFNRCWYPAVVSSKAESDWIIRCHLHQTSFPWAVAFCGEPGQAPMNDR